MSRQPSLLARTLEPLINALWVLFLVWTVVVAAVWLGGEQAVTSISNSGLREAAILVTRAGDAVWLVLGAANVYLRLAEKEGLARARLQALVIAGSAGLVAACSAWTSFPLGAVFYTTRLGMKLGPVPLGWPLLWLIVIAGGREIAARTFPRASERMLALITGGIGLLTSLNLDSIATKVRLYWFWYVPDTHQPSVVLWRNNATWFLAMAILAMLLREQKVATVRPAFGRPAAILVIFNIMLIIGHLREALRG